MTETTPLMTDPAATWTFIFLALVGFNLLVRLWLAQRQMAHVRGHRAAVPADFASKITLESHQKAADYTLAKLRFGYFGLILDTLVLLVLTVCGGLQTLHEFWTVQLAGVSPLWQGVALIFSLMLLSSLIDLPLSLYSQFVLEARFGFNRMTIGLFLGDLLKQTLLSLLIGTPVILAVLWLMAGMGERWWLYVWLFWCGFNLLILFVYPTWIAPLFNKFSPLEDGALKLRIEALLQRCGFANNGLFVMDGSKRSSHGNAYFTGLGKAKRIVFFDTLITRLQPEQIEAVLAHELGHFHHRHVIKRIVTLFALSLVFLWGLGQLMQQEVFYSALGATMPPEGQRTALALILFFIAMPVVTFLATPLGSLLSRRHEFEADAYAAAHSNAEDLVQALVKLYEDNASTLTPDPLYALFYSSHPPAAQRIAHLRSLPAPGRA